MYCVELIECLKNEFVYLVEVCMVYYDVVLVVICVGCVELLCLYWLGCIYDEMLYVFECDLDLQEVFVQYVCGQGVWFVNCMGWCFVGFDLCVG